MSRRRQQSFMFLAILVFVAPACGGGDTPTGAEATPISVTDRQVLEVETVRVGEQVLPTTVAAAGSVRARRESAIGAEVSGRITAVFVDVGDEVADGDELFRIDPVPYEIAVANPRPAFVLPVRSRRTPRRKRGVSSASSKSARRP